MYWILVNYNSEDHIHRLILSVKQFNFIVVDNSRDYIAIENEVVLRPEVNIGYIGGFQYAIRYLVRLNLDYSTLVFSNSDISFTEETMLSLTLCSSRVELVIPKIVNLDGLHQNPHLVTRRSKAHWLVRKVFTSNMFFWIIWLELNDWKKKFRRNKEVNTVDLVYAGHGSFYIFRNVSLNAFANQRFNFLYGEEVHIAEYCLANNIPLRYDGNIIINHAEHSTTAKLPSTERRKRFRESYEAILEKYYTK